MICDACGAETSASAFVCAACGVAQTTEPRPDPFELLGVEPAWQLDVVALTQRHRAALRVVHPDRFALEGGARFRRAEAQATALNDALRTLVWPRTRLCALLARRGFEATLPEPHAARPDDDFRLQLREFESALAELDGPDAHVERARIQREARVLQEAMLASTAALAVDLQAKLDDVPAQLHRVAALDAVLADVRR
jgi:molecular chaperone HscB